MITPMVSTASLTAVRSTAAPLPDASTPDHEERAGQTAFERMTHASPSPARIAAHTPDWTNLNDSDP